MLGDGEVRGLTFTTIKGAQYAYVAVGLGETFSSNLYQCTLNASGSFNTCKSTPSFYPSTWNSLDISVATVNNVPFAYVLGGDHKIYRCTINQDGSLDNFTSSEIFEDPKKITFNTVNNTLFAYVIDSSSLYQCVLTQNGMLDSCSKILNGNSEWIKPATVSFSISNGTQYSYVVDSAAGIHQCKLNASGNFNACKMTPSSEDKPINGVISEIMFSS
jgi:hypothetical protein